MSPPSGKNADAGRNVETGSGAGGSGCHERERIDITIIDVPWAFMGLHQRAFLLVSRPAVRLMSGPQLQSMAGHEIGHEFLWHEFEQSLNGSDVGARQRLELECDGIAVLTLAAMGVDPATLITAVERQVRYKERFGTPKDETRYPDIHERERFVRAVLGMTSAGRPRVCPRVCPELSIYSADSPERPTCSFHRSTSSCSSPVSR